MGPIEIKFFTLNGVEHPGSSVSGIYLGNDGGNRVGGPIDAATALFHHGPQPAFDLRLRIIQGFRPKLSILKTRHRLYHDFNSGFSGLHAVDAVLARASHLE